MSEDKKEFKFPKFKRGDRVYYLGNPGNIIGILRRDEDTGENRYEVQTDFAKFIHKVAESQITFYTGYLKESTDTKNLPSCCPRCGSNWTESGFGATKWKDCLKCKRKAEDII